MRGWVAAAVFAATFTVPMATPGTAHACSCAYGPDDPRILEQVTRAEGVFTGTATDQRVDGNTAFYEFSVREVFTGDVGATTEVATSTQGPACGTSYALGTEYLVFANTHRTHGAPWSDGSCSPTTPATNTRTRDAAVEAFGPPRAPDPAQHHARDEDGVQWAWAAGTGVAVLLLGLAGALILRRRPPR